MMCIPGLDSTCGLGSHEVVESSWGCRYPHSIGVGREPGLSTNANGPLRPVPISGFPVPVLLDAFQRD